MVTPGDTNADSGTPDPQELEQQVMDACTGFAEAVCESAEDCCLEAYGEHDQAACVDAIQRDVCQAGASAAREGLVVFDEASIEPCLEAQAELHDRCFVTWDDILELRKLLWSSCNFLDGTFAEGKGCSTDVLCAKDEGPTAALCRNSTCRVIRILEDGDECPFPRGDVSVCDAGLYCTAEGDGETGICEKATEIGGDCTAVELNPECGLGNYCDLETAKCAVATKLGGEDCAQHGECVSFSCDKVIGSCTEAPAAVPRSTCVGE
jgi:hypothetical protein